MAPPIGFKNGSPPHSPLSSPSRGDLTEAHTADPNRSALPSTHSPAADYAYRIVALTAGLALITTFL